MRTRNFGTCYSATMHRRPAWLRNWLERHQDPRSFVLHAVGIPATVFAVALAGWQLYQWRWDLWWRPAALLAFGYVLQYVGHRLEGNDMGEVLLIKKWLGRPYVAVAPRFAAASGEAQPPQDA